MVLDLSRYWQSPAMLRAGWRGVCSCAGNLDGCPRPGSDCWYHALMMQAAQRPTLAAISDVTCPPGKLYVRRAWAQLECCGFRGGTCLAVGEPLWQMVRCMGRDKKTECGVMRLGLVGWPALPEMSMLRSLVAGRGRWLLVAGRWVAGRWSARPVPAQRVFSGLELHASPFTLASRPLPLPHPRRWRCLATATATLFQLKQAPPDWSGPPAGLGVRPCRSRALSPRPRAALVLLQKVLPRFERARRYKAAVKTSPRRRCSELSTPGELCTAQSAKKRLTVPVK
jgi:hypothetical protein